ncbi:MAG: hypothetical protein Q9209_006939 [Squamulea sp. 1 TL-2023]
MKSRRSNQNPPPASRSCSDNILNNEEEDTFEGHAMTTRGRTRAAMHGPPSTPQRPALSSLNGFPVPQLPPTTPKPRSRSPGQSTSRGLSSDRTPSPDRSVASTGSQGITKKEQLKQMSPDISFDDIECIKEDTTPKPELLEAKTDTPMKTKDLPCDDIYGLDLYDSTEMMKIWASVSDAAEKATRYRGNTHEPQWVGKVASRLIDLLEDMSCCNMAGKRRVESLNISTASIAPIQLCPKSLIHVLKDANKKIDHALAFSTTMAERRTLNIDGAKYRVTGSISINQTTGWTAFTPMFANFEFKRDNRDPLIQLGSWIASEYEKRFEEDYPMDIPVPAIVVDRDSWMLWLAYSVQVPVEERNSAGKTYRVQFAGPKDMGSTQSIEGIFRILHVLKAIVKWGHDVYEPSYLQKILAKYRQK